jgi:hypothetical protein
MSPRHAKVVVSPDCPPVAVGIAEPIDMKELLQALAAFKKGDFSVRLPVT